MKQLIRTIGVCKKMIPDVLAILGAVCFSYGAYLIYKPLGFIFIGLFLIASAYLWSKAE